MHKKLEDLRTIGCRSGVIQIMPAKADVRPALLRASDPARHGLVDRALTAPTGPGGARGFRNRAGSTIRKPEVTNVYLGPFWGSQNFLEEFSKAVVENGYLDPLTELGYGTGSGSYLGCAYGHALMSRDTFTDGQARATLRHLLDDGILHGDQNSLFMFILPDGVTSEMSDSSKSCVDYCGYHDAIPYHSTDVAYAVLPSSLCMAGGGEMGDFTSVYAHLLAEACTDKIPGKGWLADDGSEIADLEAWTLMGWGPPQNPNRYSVQGYYTNERGNTLGRWNTPASRMRSMRMGGTLRVVSMNGKAPLELDSETCAEIVVNNTPKPERYRGTQQPLRDLGVVGLDEVETHHAGIIADLDRLGFHIDAGDITSGPTVNVGDCAASVMGNAS